MNASNPGRFACGSTGPRWLVRGTHRRWLTVVSVAVLMLFLTEPLKQSGHDPRSGRIALLATLAPPERGFDGRLTHFPYRPREHVMTGSSRHGMASREFTNLYALIAQIAEDANRQPSVANLHALGVAYLTIGRPNQAMTTMARALTNQTGEMALTKAIRASRDTALLNDFAAAAVAGAQSGDEDLAVGEAVEATYSAWQIGRSAEVAWNRAVALEKVGVDSETLTAWHDYLVLDGASPWADDARKSISRLEAKRRADNGPPAFAEITHLLAVDPEGADRIATLWPSACRSYVEDFLLPALVHAAGPKDRPAIAALLNYATKLSRAGGKRGGDTLFADVAIDLGGSLIEPTHSDRSNALVTAVRLYLDGKTKYRNNEIAGAIRELLSARALLLALDSPLSGWATLYLACCAYYDAEYDSCLAQLPVSHDAWLIQHQRKALVANRSWVRALALGVQNRRSDSITELERAEALFRSLGERDNVAAIASLLAEVREYLGDTVLAARSRRQAISSLPVVAVALRRRMILNEAVEASINKDLLWTALILQDKVVESATDAGGALAIVGAFMWRGLILARLSEALRARVDFDRAADFLQRIEDKPVREKAAADLAFCKATAFPDDANQGALASAAAFYRRAGNRVRLSEVYRLSAVAAIHRGALSEGEDLLRRSIKEIRFGEQQLADPASKLIYVATASQIAAAVAQEFLKRNNTDRAFALLEDIRDSRSLNFSVSHLALPDRAVVLFYFIGDETSYVWVMRDHAIVGVRLGCRRAELLVAVELISQRLPVDGLRNRAIASAMSFLYDALIAPIAPLLDGAATVVVVPDDLIANIPFPALRNRRTGRYFVQDALIVEAPSVAAFSEAERNARRALRLPVKAATVLVSDPRSNIISPLPQLRREVAAVREVAQSVRLLGVEGTEVHVSASEGFRSAILLHFAGHGDFDASSPADSALIVGGTRGSAPTRLTAREIVSRSPEAKLIFLAACDSGRTSRSVPSAGVAQWLVAVGVTSVIATVSRVEDGAAADLVCGYYKALKGSPDSAAALRSAQIAAIRHGDDFGWPSFIHFGAPRRIEDGGIEHGER
jgi:CHAT domain-containing protein